MRGKLGSTVYQVRRIDGKSTQIAKAAEDSRVNNNTDAQARYRMCYATVCHVLSDLADIIPEFIEDGLTSIRSLDYWSSKALYDVQDNFDEHFEESSPFDYARRAENGARSGEYQFAFGTLNRGAGMSTTHTHNSLGGFDYVDWSISGAPVGCTVGQWLKNARLDANQTIYVVAFACNDYEAVGRYFFARIRAKANVNRSALWANVDPYSVLEFSGSMPVAFVAGQNTTLIIRFKPSDSTDYRLIRCYGQTLREFFKNRWCVRNSWLTYPVLSSAGIQGNFSPESIYNDYWINEPVPPEPSPYRDIAYVQSNGDNFKSIGLCFNLELWSFEIKYQFEDTNNRMAIAVRTATPDALLLYQYANMSGICLYACNSGTWRIRNLLSSPLNTDVHITKYIGTHDAQYMYDNGELKATQYASQYFPSTYEQPLQIFGRTGTLMKGKIWYLKIWDSATEQIIADLRPKQRLEDSAVGFYDSIRDMFITDPSWIAG